MWTHRCIRSIVVGIPPSIVASRQWYFALIQLVAQGPRQFPSKSSQKYDNGNLNGVKDLQIGENHRKCTEYSQQFRKITNILKNLKNSAKFTPSTLRIRMAYESPNTGCCCCKWFRVAFGALRFCVRTVRSFTLSNQLCSAVLDFCVSSCHICMYLRKSPGSYAFGRPLQRMKRIHYVNEIESFIGWFFVCKNVCEMRNGY